MKVLLFILFYLSFSISVLLLPNLERNNNQFDVCLHHAAQLKQIEHHASTPGATATVNAACICVVFVLNIE
jgi:hypothetical protein